MLSKYNPSNEEIKCWKKELNWILPRLYGHMEDGDYHIESNKVAEIAQGIKSIFDHLDQLEPGIWVRKLIDKGLPEECVRWYRGLFLFTPVPDDFIRRRMMNLTGDDVKVLLALAVFKPKKKNDPVWPSYKAIAEIAGVSEKNIWRHLNKLERMGFLATVGRTMKHGATVIYRKVEFLPGPTPRKQRAQVVPLVRKAYPPHRKWPDDGENRHHKN